MSPVRATIVDESMYAVASGVVRFVDPGPTEVVTIAGTRPLALKYPSAMWPPHCSCLTGIVLIESSSFSASKIDMFPCPGIPNACLTPAFFRNSTVYWAPLTMNQSQLAAANVI